MLISKPYDLIAVAIAVGQVLRRGLIAADRLKPLHAIIGKRKRRQRRKAQFPDAGDQRVYLPTFA
jgi:hypothetical protein